jgi:hypothetical protein
MGVTIHYQGRLQDPTTVAQLVAKLQLACRKFKWPYRLIDERILGTAEYMVDWQNQVIETKPIDDRWRGLFIDPPECETLCLTFNRSGQLVVYEPPFARSSEPGRYAVREHLWCKTQFGPLEAHIQVCALLRLVEPYMAEFEVLDEGGYWESNDQEELAAALGQINQMLGLLAAHFEPGEVEIGKKFETPFPAWRQADRGISANEN